MHHGNFPTLRDVVEYYNGGNPSPIQRSVKVDEAKRPIPSPLLRKLNLTKEERLQLEAFLGAISTQVQKIQAPELPKITRALPGLFLIQLFLSKLSDLVVLKIQQAILVSPADL